MPVFRSSAAGLVAKLEPHEFANEKALQTWFEQNLETVLGVRFVATEFSTGVKHGGRIDTLGLDEAGNPVIIEYKWDKSESVINQGLFYLDWLVDHRGDFMIAVQKALGAEADVVWAEPRLIIVAGSYTKYDTYAVNQLPRSIELLRYQRYEDDVVVVEAVSDSLTTKATVPKATGGSAAGTQAEPQEYGLAFHLSKTTPAARDAFLVIRDRLIELDGVEERANQKSQLTYRTTRSFCAFGFRPKLIQVMFKGPELLPGSLDPEGYATDVRSQHWGYPWTCELRGPQELEIVSDFVKFAYDFEK